MKIFCISDKKQDAGIKPGKRNYAGKIAKRGSRGDVLRKTKYLAIKYGMVVRKIARWQNF